MFQYRLRFRLIGIQKVVIHRRNIMIGRKSVGEQRTAFVVKFERVFNQIGDRDVKRRSVPGRRNLHQIALVIIGAIAVAGDELAQQTARPVDGRGIKQALGREQILSMGGVPGALQLHRRANHDSRLRQFELVIKNKGLIVGAVSPIIRYDPELGE